MPGAADFVQPEPNHCERTILSPNIVVNPNFLARTNPLTGGIIYGLWLVGLTTAVFLFEYKTLNRVYPEMVNLDSRQG